MMAGCDHSPPDDDRDVVIAAQGVLIEVLEARNGQRRRPGKQSGAPGAHLALFLMVMHHVPVERCAGILEC
jgi:hypothetical protein